MHVIVKTPSDELPISVAEAKAHCIIDHDAHDAMLEQFIKSEVERLSPVHGWLGRAVMRTTFEAHMERFKPIIRLPFPPLVSVASIKYVDRDGVEQTVDSDDYEVITTTEPGYIALAYGKSWPPDLGYTRYPVTITFDAGYGDEPEDVPEPIRHYLMLSVAEAYTRREISEMGIVLTANKFWLNMLESYRFRFTGGE